MADDDRPPELPRTRLRAPSWAERVEPVRFLELFEKYRRKVVHDETDLPFAPSRKPRPLSLERLAFQTRGGLKLALRVFFPVCLSAFALSFLWDWHSLIRSCSVAGMIGFGTNWVAIKMLFYPRESRPVFGHGLIPSQRDDLIDKVATEVLENLINEELILSRIEDTRIVSRFTAAAVEKLEQVLEDPEFKQDLRQMVLTYVAEITSTAEFRDRIANRAEKSLEEFAGTRFRGWMVRRLKEMWRGPLVDLLNQEIERLETTLDDGLGHFDGVTTNLPEALRERQDDIDRVLTNMLLGLVREVDVREIVYEQLSTVTTEQLEQGFLEFSDDKLSYITLLGGVFGVIGGSVIVWPLPALAIGTAGVVGLAIADVIAYRVLRSSWWPWRVDEEPDQPSSGTASSSGGSSSSGSSSSSTPVSPSSSSAS